MKSTFLKNTFTLFLAIISYQLHAQFSMQPVNELNSSNPYVNSKQTEIKTCELVRFVKHSDVGDWMTSVATRPFKIEHDVPEPEKLTSIKAQKNQFKNDNISAQRANPPASFRATTPNLFRNFEANLPMQGTPPDNSMAISNDGIIVSVINSNMYYFDQDGNTLFQATFFDFYNDAELNGKHYDPKVIYDSGSDRFIFVSLHGNHSSNSKVLISFSKSNNPLDGWYIYYLPILDIHSTYTSKWLDYPNVGISNTELFITGNIFLNDEGGFSESIIIEIDKLAGYAGQSLKWKIWKDIRDGNGEIPFSLYPISWGQQGTYGPGLYFVSNANRGFSSSVHLYHLSNSMDQQAELKSYTVTTTYYEVAGDAIQKNTVPTIDPGMLDIGDCRIRDGFYQISNGKGIIHFVFHSEYDKAYNGINYNRLDLSSMKNTSKLFGIPQMDFAYPSIASSSPNGSHDRDVMIAFLASSSDYYPQIRAVHCDEDMEFSNSLIIKEGITFVNILTGHERWGDYSGISRKHNTSAPRIWMSGCYGSNIKDMGSFPPVIKNNVYRTWIAELSDNQISALEEAENIPFEINVFPNPFQKMMHIDFTLEKRAFITIKIMDMQGREIKELYHDLTKKGRTMLSFNTLALPSGNYLLIVNDGKKILKSEKILVN